MPSDRRGRSNDYDPREPKVKIAYGQQQIDSDIVTKGLEVAIEVFGNPANCTVNMAAKGDGHFRWQYGQYRRQVAQYDQAEPCQGKHQAVHMTLPETARNDGIGRNPHHLRYREPIQNQSHQGDGDALLQGFSNTQLLQ